ncbi:TIGR03943 family putative permease subunit [Desulfosporosinus shakirovi]|uniref:TIGR03943 family putative permease subunit n=1 Tax=Desulfosporosinus shakirovi TaxID=2885154 RepID=UPI001E63C230|nr:hypothetical protein [Desulfosporosinus sp. SRJS8]MCB8816735.1 hypothetical protein [Desulfosporosinus sp. SRJS8]
MQDNEFVPARLTMFCFVADLTTCALICRYDKAYQLKADTWITVEGLIQTGKYLDDNESVITVTRISSAEKPKEDIYIHFEVCNVLPPTSLAHFFSNPNKKCHAGWTLKGAFQSPTGVAVAALINCLPATLRNIPLILPKPLPQD